MVFQPHPHRVLIFLPNFRPLIPVLISFRGINSVTPPTITPASRAIRHHDRSPFLLRKEALMPKSVEFCQLVSVPLTTPHGTFPVSEMVIGGGTSKIPTGSKIPPVSTVMIVLRKPFFGPAACSPPSFSRPNPS